MNPTRRNFLKTAAISGLALSGKTMLGEKLSESEDGRRIESIEKRPLGKTGVKLSIIGFGGIVVMNTEPSHASKIVEESVEKGINYFDVAPTYGDAELKLGPALKPFRKDCFLACKTTQRDKQGARRELDASLKRLKTGYFDLYQLHAITDVEKDVKAALAKDGAIQTFLEAKKAGIIRYIGFSAHSPQAAMAAIKEFDFHTILYPINFCCHFKGQFDQQVLIEAKKREMGILALKVLAKQKLQGKKRVFPRCWYEPVVDPELAELALNWTLSKSVTAAVPPGEEKLFKMALQLAPNAGKITDAQNEHLKQLSKNLNPLFKA